MPENNTENPWVETLKTLALSAVLAFGVRTFVAEARYIPSESMLPTLEVNDRLIIEKLGHHFDSPERGDIIVFNPTEALKAQGYNQAFIKRVIGLPGETIAVKDGKVYINGEPLQEPYTINKDANYDLSATTVPENHYVVLGDNRDNSVDSRFWCYERENFSEVHNWCKKGNQSQSSYSWGFVPKDKIVGRAVVRFWPLNRFSMIDDPSYQNATQQPPQQ